jgi:hypothetical protein
MAIAAGRDLPIHGVLRCARLWRPHEETVFSKLNEPREPRKMVVCMPQFSLGALMMIWSRRPGPVASVAYGKLPFYLRAPLKFMPLSELRLMRIFSVLSGFAIEKIPHNDEMTDYPALHIRAMTAVVPATLGLEAELRRSRWTILAGRLMGEEEAVALALQTIAHRWIWPQLLQIVVCAAFVRSSHELYVVPRLGWPGRWNGVLKEAIPEKEARFFAWPAWYANVWKFFETICIITLSFTSDLITALQTRLWRKAFDYGKVRLLSEFIDPVHLNGTAFDADYLVDGTRLRPDDFLLFITREQAWRLKADGWKRSAVTAKVRGKGYKLAWIDELPLRISDLRKLISIWLHSFLCVGAPLPPFDVLRAAWKGFLRFAPLINQVQAEACLYPKIPNGNAGWRHDTAVLTGLCRRAGIVSAGCQTRVVYGPLYEFAFDCYDIHFSWGPAWYRALQPALKHVKSMIDVGCPVLDILVPALAKIPSGRSGSGRQVLIFTGDIAGGHCTINYNVSFLEACLTLAALHPDDTFWVKVKDPGHADLFRSDERLSPRLSQCPHFKFIKRPRYDYVELLASADVVLAFGFTSPGTEALLLGKPAIYYSELRAGGEAYKANPIWVVQKAGELQAAYEAYLNSGLSWRHGLEELDPYRDGQARGRILTALLEC